MQRRSRSRKLLSRFWATSLSQDKIKRPPKGGLSFLRSIKLFIGVTTLMNQFYPLWTIWREISLLHRLVVLILCGVCTYTIYSTIVILLRLRVIKSQPSSPDTMKKLLLLDMTCTNMCQVITAAFYFFGFIFFLNLPGAFRTIGDGRLYPAFEISQNFVLNFSFAANIFFIFFVLHITNSFVRCRLNSFQKRLSQS